MGDRGVDSKAGDLHPVLCSATELYAALPLSKDKIGIQIFPAG